MQRRVLLCAGGGVGAAVAAHVGRHGAVVGCGEGQHLVPPRVPQLREAVEEQDRGRAGGLAGLGNVEVDAGVELPKFILGCITTLF